MYFKKIDLQNLRKKNFLESDHGAVVCLAFQ